MRLFALIGASVVALALLLAGTAWLDGKIMPYPESGKLMAERANQTLTGAACGADQSCLAGAAPIASYGEFRRCGGYIESARLGPSRIACSEAQLTDLYLKGAGEGSSFYREFRRGCRAHDFCYTHAASTYSPKDTPEAVRAACDSALLADSVRDCTLLYPSRKEWRDRRLCRWRGMLAYSGVSVFGRDAFVSKRASTCDYEPAAHGARDQVVSGRFLAGSPEREPEQVVTLTEEAEHAGITIDLRRLTTDGGSQSIAMVEKLSPAQVNLADREQFCASNHPLGSRWVTCPTTLADVGFLADDWLRFAPIVIDSDGDGVDEIVLVSLTAGSGLVLTHVKTAVDAAGAITFQAVKAYASLDQWGEFSTRSGMHTPPLSGEFANQLLGHQFVVVQRPPGNCEPLPAQGPEDMFLMAARASADPDMIARRLFHFSFDAATGLWRLQRDQYTDDGHRLAQCADGKEAGAGDTSRLQYPALATRGPVRCKGKVVLRETLSTIVRENCPSSTVKAAAGYLNDVDLMSYNLADQSGDPQEDTDDRLQLARATWLPLSWPEPADPVMTSRAARRAGVLMVSAHVGGAAGSEPGARYPMLSVLTLDPRLNLSAKDAWRARKPDVLGLPPVQYAVVQIPPRPKKAARRADQEGEKPQPVVDEVRVEKETWNKTRLGNPRMFFELPSILAPFSINGDPGLSVVFFANCWSYRSAHNGDACSETAETGVLAKNTLQVLIAPLTGGLMPSGELPEGSGKSPRWLECPIPIGAALSGTPARSDAELQDSFLYNEPVLPGTFFAGVNGGALAIAYRTSEGRIGLTSLRKDGRSWKLGQGACRTISRLAADSALRDVWLEKLN